MTLYQIPTATSPDYFDYAELIGAYVEDPRAMLRLTNSVVDKTNDVVAAAVSDAREDVRVEWQQQADAAEREIQALYGQMRVLEGNANDMHEVLVNVARNDGQIRDYFNVDQKINAIKRLRAVTNCGLKAAMDAIRDPRVAAHFNPLFEVVGVAYVGNDEDSACMD